MLSFFFQAEDGIRDTSVTGVQTCALPIFQDGLKAKSPIAKFLFKQAVNVGWCKFEHEQGRGEIGRASCRERVEISVGAGSVKKKKQTVVVDH